MSSPPGEAPRAPAAGEGGEASTSRGTRAIGAVAVAASGLLLLTVVISPGCAGRASRVEVPPSAPVVPSAAASSALFPPSAGDTTPLAVDDPRPILADPRFGEAQRLLEAGDAAGAARAFEAALVQVPPQAAEAPRLRYQLGRLHAAARDHARAAREFTAAAQATWPLAQHASLAAGQAWLRAGQADQARTACERVPDDMSIGAAARLCVADALEALGPSGARVDQALARALELAPRGPRWAEAAVRLGRIVSTAQPGRPAPTTADLERALGLARRVLVEQPAGAQANRAADLERDVLAALPPELRARLEGVRRDDEVARLAALAEGGRAAEAERAMTDLERRLTDDERRSEAGCKLASSHARVLARTGDKKKRKAAAAARWGEAVARCTGDARVTALWQAGQAEQALGRPTDALARFEALEREAPRHRLADDARVKGAVAAQLAGDEARFTSMLERIAELYPEGDTTTEGLFKLALHRIAKNDWAGAAAPLEASLKLRPREREYQAAGRAPYFHARMLAQTGDRARAIAGYQAVVENHPLSYYMALAHARLAELDRKLADDTLARASSRNDAGPPTTPDLPAFRAPAFARAVELLRQGDLDGARAELASLGLGAHSPPDVQWALASLYARAGDAVAAHAIPRGRVSDWLDHYPTGAWRKAWELAYPRPWLDIVAREAQRQGIPSSLTYAVMREESVFDPAATSSAPAYGLMQFTLDTGRNVGKRLGLAINESALKTPAISITLGCRFLADLRSRYPACPALAIPSYNAGPGKTNAWLAQRPAEDLDVFVERIPYEETRNYTKRVLKSYAAYLFLYEPAALDEALRLPARAQAKPPEPAPEAEETPPPPPDEAPPP